MDLICAKRLVAACPMTTGNTYDQVRVQANKREMATTERTPPTRSTPSREPTTPTTCPANTSAGDIWCGAITAGSDTDARR